MTEPVLRDYQSLVSDSRRWASFSHRPGDIIVCPAPKCGTTWMQVIIATLVLGDGAPGRVTDVAPWLEFPRFACGVWRWRPSLKAG